MIIYKTTNLVNGKIYIGQDKNNNPNYYGSGLHLKKAIKKYGKENFSKEILDECSDEIHMNEREVYWISHFNSRNPNIGYNISEGGKEGDRSIGHEIAKNGIYNYWVSKYGEEEAERRRQVQIKKISDYNTIHGTSLTTKGRYSIWVEKYGKDEADKRYMEWKLKISEYQQWKMENGWAHTDLAKDKISKANKGKIISEESKKKMRKPKPPGFGEKISKIRKGISTGPSKRKKPVDRYDLEWNYIDTWDSITEVETRLKIYNINAVCKGKQETAGGYRWKYK